ncbi:MAG: 3-keto-5-aminohexanoate cleavage protein [Gammaproteobacteria bacterium]|nr:3-keto-5-aminohexanoate cleavage protein [Gammaproteobacteria bacterium]
MVRPTIITCAVTGSAPTPAKNPAVPVTPAQIADSAVEAWRAGAAIVHVHVRDPATGGPSSELGCYREVVERIRARAPALLINLTTGPGARYVPAAEDPRLAGAGTTLRHPLERIAHVLALRPDLCSLDVATMNRAGFVTLNTAAQLAQMGRALTDAGVGLELEVFDGGHLELARHLADELDLPRPRFVQLCLGVRWGLPATTAAMLYLNSRLPADTVWAAFGVGAASLPMLAQAVLLSGHARVGFEDNLYLAHGQLAPSNAALVEQAVQLIRLLGGEPATPAQARAILALPAR